MVENLNGLYMNTFAFEKLDVWKLGRRLSYDVYGLTNHYPDHEKFGLSNQLRRAVVSVCSNIAEGSARKSKKDQAHFYQLSYRSLMEVLNQLIISLDLGYLKEEQYIKVRENIEVISRQLNALRNSCLTTPKPLNP